MGLALVVDLGHDAFSWWRCGTVGFGSLFSRAVRLESRAASGSAGRVLRFHADEFHVALDCDG